MTMTGRNEFLIFLVLFLQNQKKFLSLPHQTIKFMTVTTDKTDRIKRKVEEMGVFFEQAGHSPMNGRVFAYLLLSEPPYRDFYEIQEFLGASKSAISNALNGLMDKGAVNYMTFSGDRRRYFKVNTEGWLNITKEQVKQVTHLKKLIEAVLEERSGSKHLDFNEGLQEIIDFYTFLGAEMEQAVAKWEAQRAAR